jgi:hypothetical protein
MKGTITTDLFKGLIKIVFLGIPGSASRGVFFDYEYLREFEGKIGTARKVV